MKLIRFTGNFSCDVMPGQGCNWFTLEESCSGDIDNTGDVNFQDVLRVLEAWGDCPESQ